MRGFVRKLFSEKGFAFVEGEDERDYFLHWFESIQEPLSPSAISRKVTR